MTGNMASSLFHINICQALKILKFQSENAEKPLEKIKKWCYDTYTKGKHPLQRWMLLKRVDVLTDTASPVCRQERLFFALVPLIEEGK